MTTALICSDKFRNFRGLSGTYNVRANERDLGTPHEIECLVQFLNNTQHTFVLDRRSKGQDLLNGVFKHLNLIETDFFGLKYLPQESQQHHKQSQCNNNNNNHDTTKSPITLTKTQSLNSYEHSPSSNVSLSSSAANQASNNHQKLSVDSSITNNGTSTVSVANTSAGSNSSNIIIKRNNLQQISHDNADSNISTFIEERWLDPTKSIRKQYKSNPPFKFYFRVKFYVSDPCKLADDTTRNHLYLQLRQDILNKRLIVPTDSAILLASYILQSEVGDYKREFLEEDYASNFQLLPDQSDDIKKKVIELHKTLHKSLSAADAEYQFLLHCKNLDCYGVEFYDAKDICKNKVKIGVSSNGVVVFKDNKRTNQFSWAKIVKIMFKKKVFSIQLRQEAGENCDNFIEFNLLTNQACKSFWEECVAQHSFFRLHQPKSPPKKFFSFLNFGSRFQYNGKTEYQTMEESRKRTFSHFSRTPSKRYARRTVPIGRPSWSDPSSQASKKSSDDGYQNNNHEQDNCDSNDITKSANMQDSSCVYIAPIASRSTNSPSKSINESLLNGSVDPRSAAYRPKSLTLKSFIYIDESKNIALEHEHNSAAIQNNLMRPSDEIEISDYDNLDTGRANVRRKDLKRSESLRIPSSIKGALSLTKKAGVTSSSQLARISESLRDKFLAGTKSKTRKSPKPKQQNNEMMPGTLNDSDDLDTCSEVSLKIVRLLPGKDGKYGFKIREVSLRNSSFKASKSKKSKESSIIVYDVSPNSPAATCEPRLCEGDQLLTINGFSIEGLSLSKVESLIKNIQHQKPPNLTLEVNCRLNVECASLDSSETDANSRLSPISNSSNSKRINQTTLAASIKEIKRSLENKSLIKDFESLSRKKEDETLEESKLTENIDKNRYQDILPYDSTRVQLIDSMTGDYINASFVDMAVPSGIVNRYIATQGPLASTCDDFWQMVWEQSCSLIIMVTPLVEAGRVKCHKYWPDEKEEVRYGQILIRNLSEKSKTATIDRSIQLLDVKVSILESRKKI